MDLTTEYVLPQELTGYVRAALADREVNQFTLSRYLPSQTINDLDYRFTRGGEGLIEAGVYRAWDTEAPPIDRPGIARVSGELAPMSLKARVGEYVRLKQRNLPGEVRNAIFSDAERLTRALAARVELARGDALVNGKVTLDENGVQASVDFGRDPSMSVVEGTTWDQAAVDPVELLLGYRDDYVDLNGSEPGVYLTSRKVMSTLMRNAALKAYVFPNGANAPATMTPAQINTVLNSYGLPSIELYDAKVSVGGTSTRVIPEDTFLTLPAVGSGDARQLGSVLWGTTAESLEPGYAGVAEGIVAGSYSNNDPVALYTLVSAVALPVLANPNLCMVSTGVVA